MSKYKPRTPEEKAKRKARDAARAAKRKAEKAAASGKAPEQAPEKFSVPELIQSGTFDTLTVAKAVATLKESLVRRFLKALELECSATADALSRLLVRKDDDTAEFTAAAISKAVKEGTEEFAQKVKSATFSLAKGACPLHR